MVGVMEKFQVPSIVKAFSKTHGKLNADSVSRVGSDDRSIISQEEFIDESNLGFLARSLVQASLPYRAVPGNVFRRVNGNLEFSIVSPVGIPYGGIPRLILAWITTEAVRTRSPRLSLGYSMNRFMQWLDLYRCGGSKGDITRLRMQMDRLITSTISCKFSDTTRNKGGNLLLAQQYDLWWTDGNEDHDDTASWINLSQEFFEEITKYPVPINLDVFKKLKSSPMAMDIYSWLTHRQYYIEKPVVIRWQTLMMQFGSNYHDNVHGRNCFRHAFVERLKVVVPHINRIKVDVDTHAIKLNPVPSSPSTRRVSSNVQVPRPSIPALPKESSDLPSSLRLRPATYEAAKKLAPGYDIYELESQWRDWIVRTDQPLPNDPDKAFIGFCRKKPRLSV
jgi:hypothetical protein